MSLQGFGERRQWGAGGAHRTAPRAIASPAVVRAPARRRARIQARVRARARARAVGSGRWVGGWVGRRGRRVGRRVGLWAGLGLALLFGGGGCDRCVVGSVGQSIPQGKLHEAGPETWKIRGRDVKITGSYYTWRPEGLQYTLVFRHDFGKPWRKVMRREALRVVLPLLRYAIEHKRHLRAKIHRDGKRRLPTYIGVDLFNETSAAKIGYKLRLRISRLRNLLRRYR